MEYMHEKYIEGYDYVCVNNMHEINILYLLFSHKKKYMHEEEINGYDNVWVNYMHLKNNL